MNKKILVAEINENGKVSAVWTFYSQRQKAPRVIGRPLAPVRQVPVMTRRNVRDVSQHVFQRRGKTRMGIEPFN